MRGVFSLYGILATSLLMAPLLLAQAARAEDIGGFDPFVVDDLSAPDTVATIKDPTGQAPTSEVYSFEIPAGYCNDKPYDESGKDSDCTWNSTRSQIRENVFATKKNGDAQQQDSWYGWYVYFPKDFPYGTKQGVQRGGYEFAYWHNHQCPHLTFMNWVGQNDTLYFGTNRALENYDCEPLDRLKVADFKDLVGKWTRFEVFVHWANDKTGKAEVYLNQKLTVDYHGPTLTKGYEDINYFKFGIYLCCTEDVAKIKGGKVYYAAVKQADEREGLEPEE